MQLTLLVTSPRVAPGLMSWVAWSAVSSATRRLAASLDAPLARAVVEAGHPVETLTNPTAAELLAAARTGDVGWLTDAGEAERLAPLLAAELERSVVGDAGVDGAGVDSAGVDGASVGGVSVDGADPVPGTGAVEVQVLHASYDVPGARLLDLVTVMDRLRTDCPWDREQTHRSLARYLLEETYEVLEAIESGDYAHLREELGDLLLQVYFHARVAAEAGEQGFTLDDVADGIVDKLVHRHPHVFAGQDVSDIGEVERNWETLKAAEKRRGSVLDGIPVALPALALADKVLGRAIRAGVTPDPSALGQSASGGQPSGKSSAPAGGGPAGELDGELSAQVGGQLLALVMQARAAGLDAEQALRATVHELMSRIRAHEPR